MQIEKYSKMNDKEIAEDYRQEISKQINKGKRLAETNS